MNESTTFRAFIAFPLLAKENTTIQALIKKINQPLIDSPIRWQKNLHITLQFLGNLTPSMKKKLLKDIKKNLNIKHSLILETEKLITLPSKKNPKVLALSIKKTKPLMELAALVYRLATELNIHISNRNYLPHLTLGYFKNDFDPSSLLK